MRAAHLRHTSLALLLLVALPACAPPTSDRPSILLVTLDTTRVDHLSAYGYERSTSPTLEAIARDGVRYMRARSTSSWTLPAHASLFTGLVPAEHGARHDDRGAQALGQYRVGVLGDRFVTLAERLADVGYRTAAFIGGPWLKEKFGLMQGFAHVDDEVTGLTGPRAGELVERAIGWLAGTNRAEPFFLFVNFFDAHWPYDPPAHVEGFGRWREAVDPDWWEGAIRGDRPVGEDERSILVDRYDSEIRYMDAELGRLIAAVEQRATKAGLLVVITADHGEAFGEGGRYFHNYWLSEELTRVPLVIRYPDRRRAGEDDDGLIQLTDVHDLIAREVGVLESTATPPRRSFAFAELYRSAGAVEHYGAQFDRNLQTISSAAHTLEVSTKAPPILYELAGGAGEDLAQRAIDEPSGADEVSLIELREALARHLRAIDRVPAEGPVLDSEMREALRALGYVD